jgi:hypothetical protein
VDGWTLVREAIVRDAPHVSAGFEHRPQYLPGQRRVVTIPLPLRDGVSLAPDMRDAEPDVLLDFARGRV